MLELKNITKTYKTGEITQNALNNVNISFRESEFVSILGPSGSGKTTLLNIIGGLDRYTKGDLIINNISTKQYNDADWDYYRNNSIGFVFQSYNLIPHQTVLSNVEMALTLAGVSPKERKERAISVLNKVGLKNHLHKRPNQMSGGQMQRVAIARALVNNPEILLADEPTGALDSETSIQIMELLKEIAKDKLVIMVTHNPDLAKQYSTRIVKLKDGNIIDDSNPYAEVKTTENKKPKNKTSMSFLTALSLSFNNLCTKVGRTLLTAFAGSIGIIGIALILALSTGMNTYIEDVQKETMTSYPITISSETIDVSGIMGIRGEIIASKKDDNSEDNIDGVYANINNLKTSQQVSSSIVKNNLKSFKKYLDDENNEIYQYLGENGIIYTYNVKFGVYSYNQNGEFINTDTDIDGVNSINKNGILNNIQGISGSDESATNFSEIMKGRNGQIISNVVTDSYDIVYGNWPKNYDEVLIVVDNKNEINIETMYQLGLVTKETYDKTVETIKNGENVNDIVFSYEDICSHEFYLVAACDRYEEGTNGIFSYIDDSITNIDKIKSNSLTLKVTGIIKAKEDAKNADISTSVAYTSLLTDYLIDHTNESKVVKAQTANPNINILTGLKFSNTDSEKVENTKIYLSSLSITEKASFYKLMMYYSGNMGNMNIDESTMAAYLDNWLASNPNDEILLKIYEQYIDGNTYEGNLELFGKVSYDTPYSISIYTDSFENKEAISNCIAKYNETVSESEQITYTDYVALLTQSLTTIVDGISYVLIAFVSVSLIVSCIMIGIITHISVMERTKEIGILRALGASKRNISQVFNAETFIIGCCAGVIGVGVSYLALLPINSIIINLSGISDLKAILPFTSSLVLVLISIIITIVGGLIPAKKAAKKDPVIALRTE